MKQNSKNIFFKVKSIGKSNEEYVRKTKCKKQDTRHGSLKTALNIFDTLHIEKRGFYLLLLNLVGACPATKRLQ